MAAGPRDVGGVVAPGFEPVRDAFAALRDDAALAVRVGGETVVDLWSGRVQSDSLIHVFSVSKPIAALCVVHAGADLDAPVDLPPGATVRQVLAHQAGVLAIRDPQPPEALLDWDRTVALLRDEPLWWAPGTAHGEHALFYGHLAGEILRAVDGRSIGTYLREEIGADVHCGLTPTEQARVVDLAGDFPAVAYEKRWALDNPPGLLHLDVLNSAAWRAAEIPAVNMHATARAVAELFDDLPDAMRSPEMTASDRLLDMESTWGLGVGFEGDAYGMGGLGGSLAWVDPARDLTFAYLTARLGEHDRAEAAERAILGVLGD